MRGWLGLAVLCTAMTMSLSALAQDWKLEKDEDGVKVYLKEVPGSKYKAYRGVVEIKADVDSINAYQEDASTACQWIHSCQSMKVLKGQGSDAWTYMQIAMPWPVKARDLVMHIMTEKTSDGSIIRHLKADPDYIPEDKQYVRVSQLSGEWRLMPKGHGVTEVTYQVQSEPGGSIPSWLANSFVVENPFNTLKGLRAMAEKR